MRPKSPKATPDSEAQHRRFVETARQLESDEDKGRFEEKLKRIAKAKRTPKEKPKKGG